MRSFSYYYQWVCRKLAQRELKRTTWPTLSCRRFHAGARIYGPMRGRRAKEPSENQRYKRQDTLEPRRSRWEWGQGLRGARRRAASAKMAERAACPSDSPTAGLSSGIDLSDSRHHEARLIAFRSAMKSNIERQMDTLVRDRRGSMRRPTFVLPWRLAPLWPM